MDRRSVLAALGVSALGGCLRLSSEEDGRATETSTTTSTAPGGEAGTSTDTTTGDATETSTTTEDASVPEPDLDWWRIDGEPRTAAIVGEAAYVSGSTGRFEGVEALDVRTGERRWRALQAKQFPFVTPTYDDGSVYVGSADDDPHVVELDAETGRTLAQFAPGTGGLVRGILALSADFVLVTTADDGHQVYLLGRDDLDPVWQRRFPEDEHTAYPYDAAIVEGTVVMANPNQTYALDLDDGTDRWTLDDGSFAVERAGDQLVYVHRNRVAARPLGEQVVEWSTRSPGRNVALHSADGVFVVATQDGVLTYDIETGERTWRTPFEDIEYGQGLFDPRPTTSVHDDTLWVWSRESLCGFDVATGDQTATVPLAGTPYVGRVAGQGLLYWSRSDDPVLYGASTDPL